MNHAGMPRFRVKLRPAGEAIGCVLISHPSDARTPNDLHAITRSIGQLRSLHRMLVFHMYAGSRPGILHAFLY